MAHLIYLGQYSTQIPYSQRNPQILQKVVRRVTTLTDITQTNNSSILYRSVSDKTMADLIRTAYEGHDTFGIEDEYFIGARTNDIFATPSLESALYGISDGVESFKRRSTSGSEPCPHWYIPTRASLAKAALEAEETDFAEAERLREQFRATYTDPVITRSQCFNATRYSAFLVYDRNGLKQSQHEEDRFKVIDRKSLIAVLYFDFTDNSGQSPLKRKVAN